MKFSIFNFQLTINNKLIIIWGVWMMGVIGGSVAGNRWWKTREVRAATALTKTSVADWQAGKYEFGNIDAIGSTGSIQLQADLGSWTDTGFKDSDYYAYTRAPMIKVGRFIYMLRNRNLGQFIRYDLDSREWKEMAYVPHGVYEVGDLTTNGSTKIYAFADRYSVATTNLIFKRFMEYDIATNSWSYLPEPPDYVRSFARLEFVSVGGTDFVYALQGYTSYGVWKYNIGTSQWSSVSNTAYYCESGCDMVYDGSRYLYMTTSWYGPDRFYRYDVIANTWTRMGDALIDGAWGEGTNMVLVGSSIYAMRSSNTRDFYKFNIGTTAWGVGVSVPAPTTYASMIYIPETNKIMAYGGISSFWSYDVATETWDETLAYTPSYTFDQGQNLVSDGAGAFYWCLFRNTANCYKYGVGGTWGAITNAPTTFGYQGGNLAMGGTAVFANLGSNSNAFYKYTPSSNSWSTMTAPPATLGDGSFMVGVGASYIYAARGGGTNTFYRYGVGGTWVTLNTMPETAHRGGIVGVGESLVYVLQGYNRGGLFKYDVVNNSWERKKSLPVGFWRGGTMVYDGSDSIYAAPGGDTDVFSRRVYRYSIASDTWTRVTDTPEMMRTGSAAVWYNGEMYMLQGNYSYALWKYTPATTTYKTSGNWYSPAYDLTAASSWGNFETSQITPVGTGITWYTRTSADSYLWDAWTAVSGSTIGSMAKRYVQVWAVLVGNGTSTPSIASFTVNYNEDTTAPNVSGISMAGYSAGTGTTVALAVGGSYGYQSPYFSWSGVGDTGAGVDGYYVYFGGTAAADPATLGNYQTATTYTVAYPMVKGNQYYLRIKAKDKANNVSAATTAFSFVYSGISPASSITLTNRSDWEVVGTGNTAIYTGSSSWWNTGYSYRKQFTVAVGATGTALTTSSWLKIAEDTAALETAGKVRSDRKDWRVVYWDGTIWQEVARDYEATNETYFHPYKGVGVGATDANYYVYYGKATEGTEASTVVWGGGAYSQDASGYIRDWLVLGEISNAGDAEFYTDFLNTEAAANPTTGDVAAGKTWRKQNDSDNFIDYTVVFAPGSNHQAYSFARVYSATARTVQLRVGSDDGVQAWVNGTRVINNHTHRGAAPDQDIATVDLVQGYNRILTKVDDGGGGWGLYCRFTTTGGVAITDLGINLDNPVTMSLGSEVNVDTVGDVDNGLQLSPMSMGSWAGYQLPALSYEARSYYGAMTYVNNKLYLVRGVGTTDFYILDLGTSSWSMGATTPATMYYAGMAYDGSDALYALRGNNTTGFYKYTISTGLWSTLPETPGLIGGGGNIIKAGSYFYVQRGYGQLEFYRYDIANATWSTLAAAPYAANGGAGLAWDGDDTIYGVFGGGSTGFAKYRISTNTWDYVTVPLIPYSQGGPSGNLVYRNGVLYTFTNYNYQRSDERRHYVWKYTVATNKWSPVDVDTNFSLMNGAVAYDGSRYIYVNQGQNSTVGTGTRPLYRFDMVTEKFLPETPPIPFERDWYNSDGTYFYNATGTESTLIYDGNDTIYYAQGASTNFSKYVVSEKKWYMKPSLPCYNGGAGGTYHGGYVYIACGSTTRRFYRFDPVKDEWEKMPDTPDTVGSGGAQTLVLDSVNNQMFLMRGVGTTTMYKYDIGTTTWSVGSTTPATIGASYGAVMVFDGTDYVYVLRGNNTTSFYRYQISTGAWTTLTSMPGNAYYGAGSVYDNGRIYVVAGGQTRNMYVYDVVSDTWFTGPMAPSRIHNGGGLVRGPGNTAYAMSGEGDVLFWKFNLPTTTTSYAYQGTWMSKSYDLGNPYAWGGLVATVASPSATAVTFSTRTSADNSAWGSWTEVSGLKKVETTKFTYNVGSTPQRYVQIKAVLDSEESAATPVIDDIKLYYYNDQTAPTNPASVSAYNSAVGATALTTATWYNYSGPKFSWGVGDDGDGAGVAGYYVYLGGDTTADPSALVALQTGTSYVASLTTDGDYYLRIQTRDNAGNISVAWNPFRYRYDGSAPSAPSSVAVDPRNYTAVNSFTMFWTAASDSGTSASGLLGYKYKTGTGGTGAYAADQLTVGTQLTQVPAYQDGTNTFYVKAVDNAGNESAYTEASYYYNGSAPSPPTNLAVGTSYNTANAFSFSWGLPASYTGSISEYRYSINSLPTAANYTATGLKYLSEGAYATIKGKNVLYVVAADEAGNVNYDAYASVEFTADTAAPGIPTNVEAFDNSIRATKQYKVGLTWDAPANLGTGFAGYAVYISSTAASCTTGFSSFSLAGTTAGTTYVVADIGGTALSSQLYYLCIKAYDSTNQYSAVSSTVSLTPTGRWLSAPDLTSAPTASVKTKSATITWTTGRGANSFVKYGTTSGSYGNEVGSSTQVTSHSISLANLSPGTKYYYKVLWTDEDGNQGTSNEYTLTTNSAPTVANVTIEDISLYSAYVKFTLKNATKATVEYGKTTTYGSTSSLTTSTAETIYTVKLSDLTEGTGYHVRIAAEDEEANKFNSDDYVFETLPVPKIGNVKIQQVKGMPTATVRMLWTSNTKISSIVSVYPKGKAEMSRDQIDLTLSENHQMIIKDLLDDTDYVVTVKGKDIISNEAVPVTVDLKTAMDLRPPLVMDLKVEGAVTGVGEEAKAQILAYWNTDEPGTAQIEYGEGTGTEYPYSTQEDNRLTLNHMVTVPDLKPGTVYHVRVVTKDKIGNATQSWDNVIITPKATRSALNLVVDSLSKSFGFFSNLSQVAK